MGSPVGAELDVVAGVHGEGGDGWLVRDGDWSEKEDVDVLDCPKMDVVGVVHELVDV